MPQLKGVIYHLGMAQLNMRACTQLWYMLLPKVTYAAGIWAHRCSQKLRSAEYTAARAALGLPINTGVPYAATMMLTGWASIWERQQAERLRLLGHLIADLPPSNATRLALHADLLLFESLGRRARARREFWWGATTRLLRRLGAEATVVSWYRNHAGPAGVRAHARDPVVGVAARTQLRSDLEAAERAALLQKALRLSSLAHLRPMLQALHDICPLRTDVGRARLPAHRCRLPAAQDDHVHARQLALRARLWGGWRGAWGVQIRSDESV